MTFGLLTLVWGCQAPAPDDAGSAREASVEGGPTVVSTSFFGDIYDGMEFCIDETCHTLGVGDEFTVAPPIAGPRFALSLSSSEASFTQEADLESVFVSAGVPPDAVTSYISIAIVSESPGQCRFLIERLTVGGVGYAPSLPSADSLRTPCGDFAP